MQEETKLPVKDLRLYKEHSEEWKDSEQTEETTSRINATGTNHKKIGLEGEEDQDHVNHTEY